jgi:hypothetical protein
VQPLENRLAIVLWLLAGSLPAFAADAPAFRHRASIELKQPGAFVQLPLSPADYAKSIQGSLADLRIVDADGARVPFAVLAPRGSQPQTTEQRRPATLYPLPKRPGASGAWQSPLEVSVQGDRISVKRRPVGDPVVPATSAGWLVDLGERKPTDPAPRALHLQWSGPAEFSVGYDLDSSDDLRRWRRGDSGHLMALASPAGPLTQPMVPLPEGTGRFVRLVWADAGGAPVLTAAQSVATEHGDRPLDPPAALELAATPETAGQPAADAEAARALHFDLGASLPIAELDLRLAPGTRVVPVRIQARTTADAAWRDIASAVFYRLERDGKTSSSPPLALRTTTRYLRVLPDERAAALDAAQTRLALKLPLASLVFASQGKPPLALLAGSPEARSGALPVSTLVPALDDERPRFGQATLGPWSESADVARALQTRERMAALRPALLWAVLLLGVAGLGWMVWRLARGTPSQSP